VIRVALRFEAILNQLDELFVEAYGMSNKTLQEILLSFIVIKLHDQWNFRCRQTVQLSFGQPESKMMSSLRMTWSPRRSMDVSWEPDWHIPSVSIRAGRLLHIPNLAKVQNALGAVTYIDDIRWTRNAIVHNMPISFRKFRKMTLEKYFIHNVSPCRLPLEINPISGNTVYQDWCDELRAALRNTW
jgi:hypothetical protein